MKTEIKFTALLAIVFALIFAQSLITKFMGVALLAMLAYLALNTSKGKDALDRLMQKNDKMEEKLFGKD